MTDRLQEIKEQLAGAEYAEYMGNEWGGYYQDHVTWLIQALEESREEIGRLVAGMAELTRERDAYREQLDKIADEEEEYYLEHRGMPR